ncbi:peptidoglycan editing factor PgeF [Edaphobacter flagellatus]|uniref:peptidoglycan editing factor PgeF n=1 Tax=Edaphobacter flagellatus TaxID=1933044 RepID=UPI0021B36D20|nr:peptidoglycan editing factor PgeF [Edaphobacter flagellatus]
MMGGVEIVKIPGWEKFRWLRHGFSTRSGGVSDAYGDKTLNLGWTKEDDPANVAANRKKFVQSVTGMTAMRLVTIRQVHSGLVKVVGAEALNGSLETDEGKAVLEGDGLVTNVPGVLVAAGTADCVPVLVVDPVRRAVGAFHAGWRGTVARIVEQGVAVMRREYGSESADLEAAVGPAIGACCYAVGEDVHERFTAEFGYTSELFQRPAGDGQLFVDLWEANRRQLIAAGLTAEKIVVVGECTACARAALGGRKYFSHRAESGVAGRMLNAIGVSEYD